MSNNREAAVFLDRDGTLIEDRGHLKNPSDVVFFPETFNALRELQKHLMLFIVTNQPGVAEGVITRTDVNRVNTHVVNTLLKRKVRIRDVYVCPHRRSDQCRCIKPEPYFLKKAAASHDLDLNRSFTIGDHPHDIQLARNAGARGIYVLTGHGRNHLADLPPDTETAPGIAAAAELILAHHFAAEPRPAHRTRSSEFVLDLSVACDVWCRTDLPRAPLDTRHVAQVLRESGICVHEISGGWLECEPRPAAVYEALSGRLAPPDWLERFNCPPEKPGRVLRLLADKGIRVSDPHIDPAQNDNGEKK
ncbi:MAG: HAD-IIIA family hydrolase [Phycisphaerae bacterium]|nr:HAD-IIIA family hydrolase [Phycisphaerae bacterium]